MFRNNSSRTRGRFLSLNKRNSKNNSWKSTPSSSERAAMTPSSDNATAATLIASPATDGFSQQEIRDFEEAFGLFDHEGTGSILVGSFRAVLDSLRDGDGLQVFPHMDKILQQLNARSDNETMDLNAFLELMVSTSLQERLQADGAAQANFQHVFDLFDVDRKGYVTVEDLERVAMELGEQDMTREELEEMVDRAHARQKGRVSLEEFSKMMTLNLFQKLENATANSSTIDAAHDEN